MVTSTADRTEKTEIVKSYFRRVDAGDFAADYFTADFEFFVPKYGVGRGASAFIEMAQVVGQTRIRSRHHQETLRFIEAGNCVVVEGTTEGLGRDNVAWCGGKTPGGRFCSVFEFDTSNLIRRMYIYLDPDFSGADRDRFLWRRTSVEW